MMKRFVSNFAVWTVAFLLIDLLFGDFSAYDVLSSLLVALLLAVVSQRFPKLGFFNKKGT